MLVKAFRYIADLFLSRLQNPAFLAPQLVVSNKNASILDSIFDGYLLACPKHRTPLKKIWRRRYGDDNWKYGQKLWKPKRNIITCMECGNFHEIHAICRHCFKLVNDESQKIIESIRQAWGKAVIDKEVQVIYEGESAHGDQKRIVELERPRPLWFANNLSQKSARTRHIAGPAMEMDERVVRFKRNDENTQS